MAASLNRATSRIRRRVNNARRRFLPGPPLGELLAPLPGPFRARLESLYASEPQLGENDRLYPMDYISRIIPEEGMWLYHLCKEVKPQNTLEIGLAYGFSTVFLLAALYTNQAGHHTAMDPYQLQETEKWRGIGLQQAKQLDMESRFTFLLNRSVPVLVDFAKQKKQFEVIFIDGGHLFDQVLLDFTLSAEVCPLGGYIVMDDTWMPSVDRVTEFVRGNRLDFETVKSDVENIAAFRRIGEDARAWNHFVDFARW